MKIVLTVLFTLAALAAAAAGFAYSGLYNVAATDAHNPAVRWYLDTTMKHSVQARAAAMAVPDLDDPRRIADGARHFAETCQMCHGAPGQPRSEIGQGLRPTPPALSHAARHWNAAELFWIVRHGIKMTGMPAFGPTHSDAELWSIVAFVTHLPGLSAQAYQDILAAPRQQAGPPEP